MAKGKKNRRRRSSAPGVDAEARRRERLEARRQAKAEAVAARQRKARRDKIIRRSVMLVVALGIVWFLFLRNVTPGEINGHEVLDFSLAGSGLHQPPPISYETSPPVAGPHSSTVPCGVYAEQIPNENQVHNLEHGAVGVQYEPDLPPEQIRQIEGLVRSHDSHVFAGPYEGMESNISLTAWGHMVRLDSFEEQTIRDFIDEFAQGGDAPEAFQDCPTEQDDRFRPGATPSPGASPDASPSPSPT
ncbi:MAG: DUF3105 domain-containing protein [Actinomycetota bacterium]